MPSHGAQLIGVGFKAQLAVLGESVEFDGETITALVNYPEQVAPMMDAGFDDVAVTELSIARADVATIPTRRSYKTFNGVEHEVMSVSVFPWAVTVRLARRE